jgi:uncharacterized Zn finger protein (UPF0148 family)
MINTKCPKCSHDISDKDANVHQGTLLCPNCNHEIPLLETVLKLEDKDYKTSLWRVEGIKTRRGATLTMDVSPRVAEGGKKLMFLGLIFFGFPMGMATLLMAVREDGDSGVIVGAFICSLFALIGVWAFVQGILRLYQYSYIKLDKKRLSVTYKLFDIIPISIKSVDAHQIKQVFVTQIREGSTHEGELVSYAVRVLLKTGRKLTLIKGIGNPSHAFFIEKEIEEYLDITDQVLSREYIPQQGDSDKMHEERQLVEIASIMSEVQSKSAPLVHLPCDNCGASLEQAIINTRENLIQCPQCKKVEALDSLQFSAKNAEAWQKKIKAPATAKHITMEEGAYLSLVINPKVPLWKAIGQYFPLVMLFLVIWGTVTLSGLFTAYPDVYFYTVLILVLLTLFALWKLAVRIGKRTIIDVDAIQLRHYDLFFNRYVSKENIIHRSLIKQIFVTQDVVNYSDSKKITYEVWARLNTGKDHLIVKDLKEAEQGYYLEHQIESYMGIEDEKIKEAYRPEFLFGAAPPLNIGTAFKMIKAYYRRNR